jgi:hypothetical protein
VERCITEVWLSSWLPGVPRAMSQATTTIPRRTTMTRSSHGDQDHLLSRRDNRRTCLSLFTAFSPLHPSVRERVSAYLQVSGLRGTVSIPAASTTAATLTSTNDQGGGRLTSVYGVCRWQDLLPGGRAKRRASPGL